MLRQRYTACLVLLPFAARFECRVLQYFVLFQNCGCHFVLPFHTIEVNVLAIRNRCLLMKLIVAQACNSLKPSVYLCPTIVYFKKNLYAYPLSVVMFFICISEQIAIIFLIQPQRACFYNRDVFTVRYELNLDIKFRLIWVFSRTNRLLSSIVESEASLQCYESPFVVPVWRPNGFSLLP